MLSSRLQTSRKSALPHSLRGRLHGLSRRLPGYALLLGSILRRRSMPAAYSEALAQEAGFGRMPVRVPGRMLPGFRRLGQIAILGLLLHVLLRQRAAGTRTKDRPAAGVSAMSLRDDAGTLIALARWVVSGLMGRRTRLRSGV